MGFSSLHGNISCAGYCFNDSITDRRNRHNLPLNAYVFRFGVTRRHSVSNPRIPAKWTITTSSQLSAVIDVQRTCQINGLELSVFWRFSIEQERRPPWSRRGSEHVVFLLRRGGWTAMRSKLRTAPANVSGGSPWLHTGNFCKATRQISLYLSSWVSLPDAHHQHGPISTRTSAIYSPPAASRRTESVSISQIDTSIPQQTIAVSRLVCDQSHKCYNSSLKRPDQHQNRWRQDIDIEPYRCNNAGVWFCDGFSSRSSTRSSSQDGGLHSNPKVEMIITDGGASSPH